MQYQRLVQDKKTKRGIGIIFFRALLISIVIVRTKEYDTDTSLSFSSPIIAFGTGKGFVNLVTN